MRDPYSGVRLLAVPATRLDVAVIHVERADRDGYVEKPEAGDAVLDYDHLIARVARTTIVCAEEVVARCEPTKVALIGREVTHVVEAPGGCWPAGLHPRYGPDVEHVRDRYLPAAAAGGATLQAYLDRYVHSRREKAMDGPLAHVRHRRADVPSLMAREVREGRLGEPRRDRCRSPVPPWHLARSYHAPNADFFFLGTVFKSINAGGTASRRAVLEPRARPTASSARADLCTRTSSNWTIRGGVRFPVPAPAASG